VDRLLTGGHGVGENVVHITVGGRGTVLKHRSPVNAWLARMGTGHNRMFVVRNDQGLYLFKRTINTQLLAIRVGTMLNEVRILLGRSHPGGSRGLTGERVVVRTVHAVDRRHRESQMLLMAVGHAVPIYGPIAELCTHHTIGNRDGVTNLILKRLGGISRRSLSCLLLRSLQMGLGVRQVSRARWVASSDRAFLEVALQDITAREGILAKNTHVGTITGVCCKSRQI